MYVVQKRGAEEENEQVKGMLSQLSLKDCGAGRGEAFVMTFPMTAPMYFLFWTPVPKSRKKPLSRRLYNSSHFGP